MDTERQKSLPPDKSPTLVTLDTKKEIENLLGSPLKRKLSNIGKDYFFYEDRSVLVFDEESQEYHFITKEGRARLRYIKRQTERVLKDETALDSAQIIGEGKSGLPSKVYKLETEDGEIAVKTTDRAGFMMRELAEEITKSDVSQGSIDIRLGKKSRRKLVQQMSLKDTVELYKKLEELGIKKPDFYGFTVRREPKEKEIQEYQFMEMIDRPTIQSIIDKAASLDLESGNVDIDQLPYAQFLKQISMEHYNGDTDTLIKAIVGGFFKFVKDTKNTVTMSGDNIGDIEMDNVFLIGYNEETNTPDFMVIDPIREQMLFRPLTGDNDRLLINKKQ